VRTISQGKLLRQDESWPARKAFEAALSLDPNSGPAQVDPAESLIEQGPIALLEKVARTRHVAPAQPMIAAPTHGVRGSLRYSSLTT
jgi:hypothetical protein